MKCGVWCRLLSGVVLWHGVPEGRLGAAQGEHRAQIPAVSLEQTGTEAAILGLITKKYSPVVLNIALSQVSVNYWLFNPDHISTMYLMRSKVSDTPLKRV